MRGSVALVALIILPFAVPAGATDPCAAPPFVGFDTRLTVRPLGRLPEAQGSLAGFEVVRGVPLVAEGNRLMALRGDSLGVAPLGRTVSRMAVDSAGTLYFQGTSQSDDGASRRWLARESDGRLVDVANGAALGWLHASGSHTLLEVERRGNVTLVALRASGKPFPLVRFDAPVRAVHWTDEGLAIIAGERLYVWEQSAPGMNLVLASPRLEKARAVSRAGKGRVVVAFERTVAVVTPETMTPIVAMEASCRYDRGTLYLFDHRSRTVVAVDGLDHLGTSEAAREQAGALLSRHTEVGDAEAVRLVGCEQARSLRGATGGATPIGGDGGRSAASDERAGVDTGLTVAPAWLTDSSLSGVVVRNVADGSVAERGGLRAGDRIATANAKAVSSLPELEAACSLRNPCSINIFRADKPLTVTIHW